MPRLTKIKEIAVCLCLAAMTESVSAAGMDMNLALPAQGDYTRNAPEYFLAMNDEAATSAEENSAPAKPAQIKLPGFTGSKVHQYLGLTTLALVGLTAVTAPDNDHGNSRSTTGIHPTLGRAAAAFAAATVTTGLLSHWNDIHLEDGWTDPDNMHAMLAGAGSLALLYAISRAPESGHSVAGVLGGVAMGVAVKLTW